MRRGKVFELFESIQGEGIYQGIRQVFVRFYGCNLNHCRFCDTTLEGYKEFRAEDLVKEINSYQKPFHSVSLTGGEPLLQKDFLKELLVLLKQRGLRTYLETNGILASELSELIDEVDIIAMDVKLPSSTGLGSFWPEHKRFLEVACGKDAFIKTVICNSTREEDIHRALEIISDFNLPLVLQPNSFELGEALRDKLREFQKICLGSLSDVRIIPQLHKLIGVR